MSENSCRFSSQKGTETGCSPTQGDADVIASHHQPQQCSCLPPPSHHSLQQPYSCLSTGPHMNWNFGSSNDISSQSWPPHCPGEPSLPEYDGLVLRDIIPNNNSSGSSSSNNNNNNNTCKQLKKAQHKYTPHAEKPTHVVARRNARERRRVETINGAFVKLRKHIPYENKSKRLSKFKTLRTAIEYISYLQGLVYDYDNVNALSPCQHLVPTTSDNCYTSSEVKTLAQMGNLQWLQQHFVTSMKSLQRRRCSSARMGHTH